MSAPIRVLDIRSRDGDGSVKAFVDIQLSGITIKGAKIVQQDGQRPWLAMPSIKTDRAWLNVESHFVSRRCCREGAWRLSSSSPKAR